jgi:predicted nucleic acid-binding protein
MGSYLAHYRVGISAVTVLERVRGYSLAWQRAGGERREQLELWRTEYLANLGEVWPVSQAVATVAGEIMALIPNPSTPAHHSHRLVESRQERLARWRFDCMIAGTALVAGMPLIHNNTADFEAIRSAIERSPARFPTLGPLGLIRCTSLT